MELTKALTKERQDRIYKLYLTAFPESERKPFPLLIEKQEEGIVDILSIEEDGHFLGLAIMQMGIGWDQGGITVVMAPQAIGYPLIVPKDLVRRPETIALDMGQCPLIAHLTGQMPGLHRTGHILPNIKVSATSVLIPPFHQRDIVGRGMPDLPINLWNVIINRSSHCPSRRACSSYCGRCQRG